MRSRLLACLAVLVALVARLLASYYSSEIVAGPSNTVVVPGASVERVLLVVVDGMRADTMYQSGCMPGLAAYAAEHLHGTSQATEITMTGVGVRALGTGTSSGIATLAQNWSQKRFGFDNLFASLHARGGDITVVGNETWMDLFGDDVTRDLTRPTMAHVMHYANPVYGADLVWAEEAREAMSGHFDLAVVHLGGLDNASHLFTPFGRDFCAKAKLMDSDVTSILRAAGDRTTVILTSDHGTSDRGHHGSGEPEARMSPLVLAGPGFVGGGHVAAEQVDIAPTIASLLALPIPYPAEGRVLTEWLDTTPERRAALATADLARAQAYANRYAEAKQMPAPVLRSPSDLGRWLAQTRGNGALLPLALVIVLCLLVLEVALGASAPRLVLEGVGSVLFIGGAVWSPLALWLGWCGVLLVGVPSAWALARRANLRDVVRFVAWLSIPQALVLFWRMRLRLAQLAWGAFKQRIPHGDVTVAPALVAVFAGAGIFALRRVRLTASVTLGVLFGLALFGDQMAIPATLGALLVVAALAPRRLHAVLAVGVVLVTVCLCKDVVPVPFATRAPIPPAPLLVGVLGAIFVRRPRLARLVPLAFGIVGTLVLAGGQTVAFRSFLFVGAAALVVGAFVSRDRLPLVAIAAVELSFLSRPQQVPGLIAIVALGYVIGALSERAPEDRRLLFRVVGVVGVRMLFFLLFEGSFSFSSLEIRVGYLHNPGQNHVAGALAIVYKFFLPAIIAVCVVLPRAEARMRGEVLDWVLVFFGFRLFQIILSLTVTRGTFHSPYVDVGHLFVTLLFTLSFLLLRLGLIRSRGHLTRGGYDGSDDRGSEHEAQAAAAA